LNGLVIYSYNNLIYINAQKEDTIFTDVITHFSQVTCDDKKHGLQFELLWDKDANPHKKISLIAEAVGNKKEVLLEIPGRYLKGEVVTV
jgi:hypothetical protein